MRTRKIAAVAVALSLSVPVLGACDREDARDVEEGVNDLENEVEEGASELEEEIDDADSDGQDD